MMYYWLAAVGICFIVKYGKILETSRNITSKIFPFLSSLYKCCLCMGFWVGVAMIPFLYIVEGFGIELIFFPFSVSAICWIADSVLTLIHSVTLLADKLEKE